MGKVFNMVGGGGGGAPKVEIDTPTLSISAQTATASGGLKELTIKDQYIFKYDRGGQLDYNFSFDGVQKQSSSSNTYDFSSEPVEESSTHTVGVNVSATGIGTSETVTKTYIAPEMPKCVVSGLGSSSPSSVTFTVDPVFSFDFEEVTKDGNVFIKIPKMSRKVNMTSSDPQITSYTLKLGHPSGYDVYPCFLKEDGTEMDYILMGKYCCSSTSTANSVDATAVTMTVGAGRTLCRNKGTGYLQMDWQIFKLWQDLLTCAMRTVDTNPGTGITTDALGIVWKQQGTDQYPWIDGIASPASGNNWVFSYKPSQYIDSPSASSSGYQQVNYARPTASGNITALGYDSNYPFVNYPKTASGSTYTTYYCDRYYYGSGSHPVRSLVGAAAATDGAFRCYTNYDWSSTVGVRLCYRPL